MVFTRLASEPPPLTTAVRVWCYITDVAHSCKVCCAISSKIITLTTHIRKRSIATVASTICNSHGWTKPAPKRRVRSLLSPPPTFSGLGEWHIWFRYHSLYPPGFPSSSTLSYLPLASDLVVSTWSWRFLSNFRCYVSIQDYEPSHHLVQRGAD